MNKFKQNLASHMSTILGIVLALANAWANVDWSTFESDFKHIMPLATSGFIALGGYFTSINFLKPKE